jgi:hypothetical protein
MAIIGASFSDGAMNREVPETGRYLCHLVDVEQFTHTVKSTGNQMQMLRWIFNTVTKTNADGEPFVITKLTSTSYGGDSSWLTQLLDQMLGKRLTRNEFNALDTEDLKKKQWVVALTKTVNARGYDAYEVDSVKEHVPSVPAKAKPKPVKVEDIKDPFDEEEDDLPFLD